MLPPPVVEEFEDLYVVRDDLVHGGTKRRAVSGAFAVCDEVVFAGPAQGWAQVALGYGAQDAGKRAVVYIPRRRDRHPLTLEALSLGVDIRELRPGRLSQLQAAARTYADEDAGRLFLPLGLFHPGVVDALTEEARRVAAELPAPPPEVWCAAGGGALALGLARGFPGSAVFGVEVGRPVPEARRAPGAVYFPAEEEFSQECPPQLAPPFPSSGTYDAKAWRWFAGLERRAPRGSLFWNVAP